MRTVILCCFLCGPLLLAATASEPLAPALERRIVQLPGTLDRPDLEEQLTFLHALGFNGFWVRANQIAAYPLSDSSPTAKGFDRLADWCRQNDARLLVSLNPVLAGSQTYALSDRAMVRAIRRFVRRVGQKSENFELILSFEDARAKLTELRDLLAYGRFSAAAHVDLTSRVRSKLPRRIRLWYEPVRIRSDPELALTAHPNATASLPPRVGIVWQGARNPAPTVSVTELDELLQRAGVRPVMLRDRFPANQHGSRMPLSHNLGPLRGRSAALAARLAGHVSVAMEDWGASRLTLMTVADWLRTPDRYIPKESWERAMAQLAGDDAAALDALRTQALEWGGPLGGRNHHTAETDNPSASAAILRDPALVSRWRWTLTRYAQRIDRLRGLADPLFRDELIETMSRRLAIARAIPPLREILARQAAGRSDLAGLLEELHRLRNRTSPASAQIALDRFLRAAGVGPLLRRSERLSSPLD